MAKFNFLVLSNCTDPSREEEFNRWYTHIHLPDLSGTKGLVSAKRYVDLEPDSSAKYLALYEFETDDIEESLQSLYGLAAECWPKGRHIDCMEGAPDLSSAVVTFKEIEPESLEAPEDVNYSADAQEAVMTSFSRS
jgi:hypothetical protein